MGSDVLPKVIIEHAPTQWLSVEGLMLLLIGGCYFALLASVRSRGFRVVWLLPTVWFVLALSRVRHGPIFAFTTAIVMLDMLPFSPIIERLRRLATPNTSDASKETRICESQASPVAATPRFARVALPCAMVIICFTMKITGTSCPVIGANWCRLDSSYWPVEATVALKDHLHRHPEDNRVFNDMRFGGYLIYTTPTARIYIDDRCELYRDPGLRRYIELLKHPERFDGEAAYQDIRTALVHARSPIAKILSRDHGWTLLHSDQTAMLFVRSPALAAARR